MNQIKFRAYRPSDKSMMPSNSLEEILRLAAGLGVPYSIDEIIWLQFTGLQDKNGVDIHEGDIVSQKLNCLWDEGRHNLEVRFNHDQFQTGNVKSYSSLYSAVQSFDAEIIGNIHQHPELLESVK
jgi:uncharacterized phage protein (TIGR01671 family)